MTLLAVSLLSACTDQTTVAGTDRSSAGRSDLQQTLGGIPDPRFARALEPRPFSFPQDHGAHPDFQTEWWYFTGHLRANAGAQQRRFGYQLTFFRQALKPGAGAHNPADWSAQQLYLAHFAVSDLDRDGFYHHQRLARGALGQGSAAVGQMDVAVEDWHARWRNGQITLQGRSQGESLALTLTPFSPIVAHGDDGLSVKSGGAGNASYYYSIPELSSQGTLTVDGQTFEVTGRSWLDREWSTSVLGENQSGWDWFSLNLGQGRYLMLFQLRNQQGRPDAYSAGTLVAGSQVQTLTAKDFKLTPLRFWTSPQSQARYPVQWRIEVPAQGLELELNALLDGQEINQLIRYWEGAVAARGRLNNLPVAATGYLEMTGYDRLR